ncbi:MAG TPA: type VI secretion system baseplate subunit TssK [Burkholderiaceae bacterium]|jgi:type VI secretion system protein ImpJ|nr:type VI secretion system baseplate subunit TssK [Burkholderiaceae bacterium]
MSSHSRVAWVEGLFLQPQHLQQQERRFEHLIAMQSAARAPLTWGFSELEIDESALALGKLVITKASGVLPDGTWFDIPRVDPAPAALDISPDAKDELIVLALPLARTDAVDFDFESDGASMARHAIEEIEVRDSALPGDRFAPIQIGRLRLRLLPTTRGTAGFVNLGVAQIAERRADGAVALHRDYLPPVLRIGAAAPLLTMVQQIQGLLHQRGEVLAQRLAHPGRGGVAEIAEVLNLQAINRHEPVFVHFAAQPSLHPELLYRAMLALAGDLATFDSPRRRVAEFSSYRQHDLRASFTPLLSEVRRLLSLVLEQTAVPIELQVRSHGVRVAIIRDSNLLKSASFVLAASAQMPMEALRSRFPAQVKLGPAERIRDLVNLQLSGIALSALPVAPRQIPFHAGFAYFELDRGGELWRELEKSGGMALHVGGEFPGLELEFWAIRG